MTELLSFQIAKKLTSLSLPLTTYTSKVLPQFEIEFTMMPVEFLSL